MHILLLLLSIHFLLHNIVHGVSLDTLCITLQNDDFIRIVTNETLR